MKIVFTKTTFWGICVLLSIATLGCSQPESPISSVHTKPEPAVLLSQGMLSDPHADWGGLRSRPTQFPTYWIDEPAQLMIIAIDKADYAPSIVGFPQQGSSARQVFQTNEFEVLIGSGFVTHPESLTPVGLLKLDNIEHSPIQVHGYTRILGELNSNLSIVHRAEYDDTLFNSALQLGPGIIEKNKLDISKRDLKRPRFFRSFVGLCEHQWLVGISFQPSHLRTLGESLIDFFQRENLNCTEVVNLAGDRQALLIVKSAEGEAYFHGEIDSTKASFIGFNRKATAQD